MAINHERQQQPEHKNAQGFIVEGHKHIIEALGLMKDWVTALIGIQTAAIGAIAAFSEIEQKTRLTRLQSIIVCLIIAAFGWSIICGSFVLNMLPGCAQRVPQDESRDIYSMRTKGDRTLGFWAINFRNWFIFGIALFVVFIVVRTWPF